MQKNKKVAGILQKYKLLFNPDTILPLNKNHIPLATDY